jgi:hypothetical protein
MARSKTKALGIRLHRDQLAVAQRVAKIAGERVPTVIRVLLALGILKHQLETLEKGGPGGSSKRQADS